MKANVWEFEGLGTLSLLLHLQARLAHNVSKLTGFDSCVDVAGNMDKAYSEIEKELEEKLSSFGYKHNVADRRSVPNWLRKQDNRLPGIPMMELRGDIKREKQPHLTESIY